MILKNKNIEMKGFTLVELLAVIVILAIILVIAVPKVMSVIEDAKKAILESTAKMIASQAEKQKVQNTVLGKTETISCDSVAKTNDVDYEDCDVDFDGNTAKVTIVGAGKFDGLYVCNGTKTSAVAQAEECISQVKNIEVSHPLLLMGQRLTPEIFDVSATYDDGSTAKLWAGGMKSDETREPIIITSPNWPENYNNNMTKNENFWEATYEGAEAIQITFDETSETEGLYDDYLLIYDKDGNEIYRLAGISFSGKTYTIPGDYVKVAMVSDNATTAKGFSATIKPANDVSAEYTVSPSVVPNNEDNFDIIISVNGQSISKKITASAKKYNVEDYLVSLQPFENVFRNGLKQTKATYNGKDYNAGLRYLGSINDVKNKVYYNCDDTDTNGVVYGKDNYDYASSCEVWRIIGVFNTKTSPSDINGVSRVKLINISSKFQALWDTSPDGSIPDEIAVNDGQGINQWGEVKDSNGNIIYEGADLMRLLNGYYIGTTGASCIYCGNFEHKCSQACTAEELKNKNMKVLTTTALAMIDNAVWDTYAVTKPRAVNSYLQEKGIMNQYTGKSLCATGSIECTDDVTRTESWTGLVGLMSYSDAAFADGWLYGKFNHLWTITPYTSSKYGTYVFASYAPYAVVRISDMIRYVYPSVYLKQNIKIIGGNGDTEPYRLVIQ